MDIPTRKECFELIQKTRMLDHIIDHSVMVSNVCFFLCRSLIPGCPTLKAELAVSAALLHDITKTRSFDTNENHCETGGHMLRKMGYPEVADIIRQHVILDRYDPDTAITEQELVNYSDKRVLHDDIVSLDQRLEYIEKRYAGCVEDFTRRFALMAAKTRTLERKIFSRLAISPGQLAGSVKPWITRI